MGVALNTFYDDTMKLKQLFTNDNDRLSTTNTIQMMSAITLCIGFFIALWLDRSIAAELGFIIAGMATLTATSKGLISSKIRDTNHLESKSESQNE